MLEQSAGDESAGALRKVKFRPPRRRAIFKTGHPLCPGELEESDAHSGRAHAAALTRSPVGGCGTATTGPGAGSEVSSTQTRAARARATVVRLGSVSCHPEENSLPAFRFLKLQRPSHDATITSNEPTMERTCARTASSPSKSSSLACNCSTYSRRPAMQYLQLNSFLPRDESVAYSIV